MDACSYTSALGLVRVPFDASKHKLLTTTFAIEDILRDDRGLQPYKQFRTS
jgi:hypothetical protein